MHKDLRDTYASQLLTCGCPVGYISGQLGHASIQTTIKHYAKWVPKGWQNTPVLDLEREVPADLLSRLESQPVGTQQVRSDLISL